MRVFLLMWVLTASASENNAPRFAPKNFAYQNGQAVFIDFEQARYAIEFDARTKTARSLSTIEFTQSARGYPLFDIVPKITEIKIDGQAAEQELISSPDKTTSFRVLKKELEPGRHVMEVTAAYAANILYEKRDKKASVSSSFFFDDVNADRKYLEQYLPANLEYDQYPAEITLYFKNFDAPATEQDVFTNGTVLETADDHIKVVFPAFYNSASFFLHTAPKGKFKTLESIYEGIENKIPILVFTKTQNLEAFMAKAKDVLKNLEKDFGSWPHGKLVIYAATDGGADGAAGMEYSGATVSDLRSISHEMFHSYNARSTAPAAAHAGWMDEAIAMWRDGGFFDYENMPPPSGPLSSPDSYVRSINNEPYYYGKEVVAGFSGMCKAKELSLKKFFRQFYTKYRYQVVDTSVLQSELGAFMSEDLAKTFETYVYGRYATSGVAKEDDLKRSFHKRWTPAELRDLL